MESEILVFLFFILALSIFLGFELIAKVPATLHSHPFFVKDVGQKGGGEWRFIFRSEEDEHRQIAVHMFLFDLFVS